PPTRPISPPASLPVRRLQAPSVPKGRRPALPTQPYLVTPAYPIWGLKLELLAALAIGRCMRRENPRDLRTRRLQQAGKLGRRRLDEADDLAAQLVERGQRCQRPHAGRIERLPRETPADDPELVVAVGKRHSRLSRRDRIVRKGDRGRAGK